MTCHKPNLKCFHAVLFNDQLSSLYHSLGALMESMLQSNGVRIFTLMPAIYSIEWDLTIRSLFNCHLNDGGDGAPFAGYCYL
jgi:hypothetical protein